MRSSLLFVACSGTVVLVAHGASRRASEVDAFIPTANASAVDRSDSLMWVRLGSRLFTDVKLSSDSTISCSTCHVPERAFTEPRAVSHGIGERARHRNTPSLINVARFKSSFDWDGRAGSLEDQLRGVFAPSGDMGIDLGEVVSRIRSDPSYDVEFRTLTGRRSNLQGVITALVAFQKTLVDGQSRFDKFYLGADSAALSDAEKRGWMLFRTARAGCAGCHVPLPEPGSDIVLFRDRRFHNLGVGYEDGRMADAGRFLVTRQPFDWGSFRTPSLRNVELTSPYMHDGSIASLEEVVDFYAQGAMPNPNLDDVLRPRDLSQQERSDLVAFLRSLTSLSLPNAMSGNGHQPQSTR